jgi:gliding motility-associated-like protein
LKSKLLLILLLINFAIGYAQREAGIWYFGQEAGLDFNSGSPVAITNGKIITGEGCATISDHNGNLLFYTDGRDVYNAQHRIMPNGNGLLGHSSSTQSAIIVPNPNNPFIYYIFTVDEPNNSNADGNPLTYSDDKVNDGLNYSEVNMNLDNGLGDINPSKKNIHLITYNSNNTEESLFKCSEKISAVQHADGNSIWVITHFINKFYAFQVSNSGVQTTPKISTIGTTVPTGGYLLNAVGFLKSSPDGKKLGIVHMATKKTNETGPKNNVVRNSGKVELYDFNNSTGIISNPITLLSGVNPYGIAFSSKTKKLYVTSNNYNSEELPEGSSLFQFDLEQNDIPSSKVLIKKNGWVAGALQLAIDEKIYRAGYPIFGEAEYLSVIHAPEKSGTDCNFKERDLFLEGKKAVKGLPPFIQSLFLFNFKYQYTCLGDSTHFYISTFETIDAVLWDFGDGTTSTDIDAYHTYKNTGVYTVSLTKTVNGEVKEPITKEVTITEKPIIFNTTYQLVQCDSYDSNPNDELAVFNLASTKNSITLNNTEKYDVFFYLNDTDANNDLYNLNALPENFTNTTPNQIITVKVMQKNSSCYSLGNIELIANSSLPLTTTDLVGCETNDGEGVFDFNAKKEQIINSLGLPSTLTIDFFDSEQNVINNSNPISGNHTSIEKKIYFRAENNGICYGAGYFNLIINKFPPIELNERFSICEDNFPFTVSATIPPNLQNNYTYLWSNGSSEHNITVNEPQEISVTITDKIFNCSKIKKINIEKVTAPIIISTKVNINTQTVTVTTEHNFDNQYSLDNTIADFQNENIFTNVQPGSHTVFVKNKYNCALSHKKIYVLGFPKFLTPNNDGFNDVWSLKGLDFENFSYSNINIFDRFGKLIITLKPGYNWNGMNKGETLPTSDYWFTVSVTNKEQQTTTFKGHFSLIR